MRILRKSYAVIYKLEAYLFIGPTAQLVRSPGSPRRGVEPVPRAAEVGSPNRWTTGEVPSVFLCGSPCLKCQPHKTRQANKYGWQVQLQKDSNWGLIFWEWKRIKWVQKKLPRFFIKSNIHLSCGSEITLINSKEMGVNIQIKTWTQMSTQQQHSESLQLEATQRPWTDKLVPLYSRMWPML